MLPFTLSTQVTVRRPTSGPFFVHCLTRQTYTQYLEDPYCSPSSYPHPPRALPSIPMTSHRSWRKEALPCRPQSTGLWCWERVDSTLLRRSDAGRSHKPFWESPTSFWPGLAGKGAFSAEKEFLGTPTRLSPEPSPAFSVSNVQS